MKKCVFPSEIAGWLNAPASKSMMQRVLAAALLAPGRSEILDPGYCADTLAAMAAVQRLGAKIRVQDSAIEVQGGFHPVARKIDCNESGLSLRLFTAVSALDHREIELGGSGSLLRRPVGLVETPLASLGARVSTDRGFPPVRVRGPLAGGEVLLDGSLGSQFLTGLLMALPLARSDSRITVRNLQSIPYIDMTLQVLADFGIHVENDHYHRFFIGGRQAYAPRASRVEGDWSGASFLLVAGAIAGRVTVAGLRAGSAQADRMLLGALDQAGAEVGWQGGNVTVARSRLRAFDFDATHAPDLFPPLVALACHCSGKSRIQGVERLHFKESNRALSLLQEFRGLGAKIAVAGNTMEIEGGPLSGGTACSHGDHRIAMAVAVAALAAQGAIAIDASECVGKSYPRFFEDLAAIGGKNHE
jgi:3-phosphoshikimate 1-carboxyvinyltransferase